MSYNIVQDGKLLKIAGKGENGEKAIECTQAEYDEYEAKGEIQEDVNYFITDTDDNSVDWQKSLEKAKQTGYWRYGETMGLPPGLIRSGYIPKKIVFLGNSMTCKQPVEYTDDDHYSWTVYDKREMGASLPWTGWCTLVRNELKKLNPNIIALKGNVGNWETRPTGTRSFAENIAPDTNVGYIDDEGSHNLEGKTVGDILTNDVDVIIFQGYENMPVPNVNDFDESKNFVTDFTNLWDDLRAKCPNATLYDFCGFWDSYNKNVLIASSCMKCHVNMIYPWSTKFDVEREKVVAGCYLKEGDKIYDADGTTVLYETDRFVAAHPNDAGFRLMAFYTLMALYNGHAPYAQDCIAQIEKVVEDENFVTNDVFVSRSIYVCYELYDWAALNSFANNVLINSCIRLTGRFSPHDRTKRHAFLRTFMVDSAVWGSAPYSQVIELSGDTYSLKRHYVPDSMYGLSFTNWTYQFVSTPMYLGDGMNEEYDANDLFKMTPYNCSVEFIVKFHDYNTYKNFPSTSSNTHWFITSKRMLTEGVQIAHSTHTNDTFVRRTTSGSVFTNWGKL